ncbi:MAG: hypothetical protein L7U87_06395 [Chlamydiales bacterium]|nr:hypothetical protein [Chlamydiales bacterium]
MDTVKASSIENTRPNSPVIIIAGFLICAAAILYLQAYLPPEKSWTYSCLILIFGIITSISFIMTKGKSSLPERVTSQGDQSPFLPEADLPDSESLIINQKDLQSLVENLKQELHEKETLTGNLQAKVEKKDHELERRFQQLQSVDSQVKDLKKELEDTKSQLSLQEKESQQEHSRKDSLLEEYKTTIAQQREIIEKKQNYNSKLEAKVSDLSYEIKALLQLEDYQHNDLQEKPNLPQTSLPNSEFDHYNINNLYETIQDGTKDQSSNFDAFSLLDKYVSLAQKFKPSETFHGNSNSLSANRFHLDLRHLYDILEGEEQFILFVYSFFEQKIIFTNKRVKQVLSFSPDSFCHNFKELIQKGREEWEAAVSQEDTLNKEGLRLIIKSQTQEDTLFHCYLQKIPKGIFNSFALGLLIPA